MRPKTTTATWLQFWLLPPWLPLPRSSPMGLQNQGLYLTSAGTETGAGHEDTRVLCAGSTSVCSQLRGTQNTSHMGRLGCHLITSDNLVHSTKPTAFLSLLKNKTLVESTSFHLPPKYVLGYDNFLTKPYMTITCPIRLRTWSSWLESIPMAIG